ncbi:MAG: chorismate synthase [bacterium]
MLSYLTAGESHGPRLTAIVDGLPAGLRVDPADIDYQLMRRQKGYGRGGRMKIETDRVRIVGGVRHGLTLGGPVSLEIENKDWVNWTQIMDPICPTSGELDERRRKLAFDTTRPRPGHADLAGGIKYNHHDLRNVLERASARETAAKVAVGSLVRQLLEHFGMVFASHVIRIGPACLPGDFQRPDLETINRIAEDSRVRCLDPYTEGEMIKAIKAAGSDRDSLGGVAEVIISGVPVGLGSYAQSAHRLDGKLAGALMAIPSVKGVEIGLGFAYTSQRGSTVHDQIFYETGGPSSKKGFMRPTHNAGGIEGGISNGEPIVARVAGKPISTLNRPLKTVDVKTKEPAEAMVERTDVCVTAPLAVVCEAVAGLVLAESFLDKFGGDNMDEIDRNYQAFLDHQY